MGEELGDFPEFSDKDSDQKHTNLGQFARKIQLFPHARSFTFLGRTLMEFHFFPQNKTSKISAFPDGYTSNLIFSVTTENHHL